MPCPHQTYGTLNCHKRPESATEMQRFSQNAAQLVDCELLRPCSSANIEDLVT
jgi:hypothetical protein